MKLSVEYAYGFCETAPDVAAAISSIRQAACHTDPPAIANGGIVQSQSNPEAYSISFYERTVTNRKVFVARVFGPSEALEKIAQLV